MLRTARGSYTLRNLAWRNRFSTGKRNSTIVRERPILNWRKAGFSFLLGAGLGYSEVIFELYGRITSQSEQTHEETKRRLEYELKIIPLYRKLSRFCEEGIWNRSQSWEDLDRNYLSKSPDDSHCVDNVEHIARRRISQPGGLAVSPVTFHNQETGHSVTFVHVGHKLCGFPFIVHGGMVATILNESLKRLASKNDILGQSSKSDYMIQSLSISYLNPTYANQFLIVRCHEIDETAGGPRARVLRGTIEDLNGLKLVDCQASLRKTRESKSVFRSRDWIHDKIFCEHFSRKSSS